jgi:Flp pilus assembly protein TadD
LDAAQHALAGILALEPENAAANLLAGRGAMRTGDLTAARRFLAVTARGGTPAERAAAHNNLGILDMREGRSAEGRAKFETALSLAPREPMAYVFLARWYQALGRPDSARAVLERGLAVAEPSKPIQDELATLR